MLVNAVRFYRKPLYNTHHLFSSIHFSLNIKGKRYLSTINSTTAKIKRGESGSVTTTTSSAATSSVTVTAKGTAVAPTTGAPKKEACGPVAGDEDDDDSEEMFIQGPAGVEWGGPTRGGRRPEPTRFGDWERKGRVSDF